MELKYGQWAKKRPTLIFYVNLIFYFIFLNVFCLCAVHAFLPVKRLLDKVFYKHLSPEQCYALQSHFFFLSKKECLLRSNNYNSLLNILVFFACWIGQYLCETDATGTGTVKQEKALKGTFSREYHLRRLRDMPDVIAVELDLRQNDSPFSCPLVVR